VVFCRQQSKNSDRLCSTSTTSTKQHHSQSRCICTSSLLHTRTPNRPLPSQMQLSSAHSVQKLQCTTRAQVSQVRSAESQTRLHASRGMETKSTGEKPSCRSTLPAKTPCTADRSQTTSSTTYTDCSTNSRSKDLDSPRSNAQHSFDTFPSPKSNNNGALHG
jgi:hypothetical protein